MDIYSYNAIYSLYEKDPANSAKALIYSWQKYFLLTCVIVIFFLAVRYPIHSVRVFILTLNCLYTLHFLFKALLFLISSLSKTSTINLRQMEQYPEYCLLIPLYREEKIFPQTLQALKDIDYPEDKLDIKIIVEADDNATINAIKKYSPLPQHFHIVRVPASQPRTKPKACNYALQFTKAEYVAIYDAEDIPDPLQLKKVVQAFSENDKDVICVQCRLNFYNRNRNRLTKFFALEYGAWFNFMIPALSRLNSLIPLGGTSNHFKLEELRN